MFATLNILGKKTKNDFYAKFDKKVTKINGPSYTETIMLYKLMIFLQN